jgi:hypothetical protein
MLNKAPIFLNCFSRGGSNILWNMFLTHPDVASPMKETLEIFRTGLRHATWPGYKMVLLSRQPKLLDQWNYEERTTIPTGAQKYLDQVLFDWKVKTFEDGEMKWKSPDEQYTLDEVRSTRLVAKNNNGTIFLTDVLLQMYPDATFVALTRDPFALYESHKRRKITTSAKEFGAFYRKMTDKMLADAARLDSYNVIKFEDLLREPLDSLKQLYAWTNLDAGKVDRLRFKAKPHLQQDGQHTTKFTTGQHYWFAPVDVYQILEKDINKLQADRLEAAERDAIIGECRSNLEKLGYLD